MNAVARPDSLPPQAAQNRYAWEIAVLMAIAAAISVCALVFYYRQGALLLYGDAVAHINIARRVFDSRTPGLLQFGTVWLPLPHLLDIPFIVNDRMWQSGLGASIPSMIAYVAGVLGIFRLVSAQASRAAAWVGALIYTLNPNLIYLQATAMTESLYLALFIWAVVYFAEFSRQANESSAVAGKALIKCGVIVSAAMLVRYDGWFLAAVIALGALIVLWRMRQAQPSGLKSLKSGLACFLLFTGAAAASYLVYNYISYGNPLEFATGEYSPRQIVDRSRTATMPTNPGEHAPRDAALQFLKIARLAVAEGRPEKYLATVAFVALLAAIYFSRHFLPWTILWTPALFYTLCIAWGSVPVFHPEWWPFSYYNVRYGLQLLPAIAVFTALAVEFAARFLPARLAVAVAVLLGFASSVSVWRATPICLREAEVNGRERMALEQALAAELQKLPPSATLMMDCSAHPGAVQLAGIPFLRILRESNRPLWKPALAHPAQAADYVIAFPGDAVDLAVQRSPQGLRQVATVGTPRQPGAVIYRAIR